MFRFIILGLMVIAMPGVASAGPFGIEQGMKNGQLDNLKATQRPFRFSINPPKPHSRFDTYVVKSHPQTGVCMLSALGVTLSISVYGAELREEFDSIRGQISGVYGSSDLSDYLRGGSIWDEPEDWTTGLLKNERVLQASWDRRSSANLKDGIVEILLTAKALGRERGWLSLQYRFANEEQCENLIDKESAKSF